MIALYWDLFTHTLRDPGDAARRILLMSLPPRAIWLALVLSVVLNTLVFLVSGLVLPVTDPAMPALASPGLVFIMLLALLMMTVVGFTWLGRALGGHGGMPGVAVLLTWLQFMRLAVQISALLLMFVAPMFSNLLVLGAGIYGVYILVHFMNEAHGFGALSRSFLMIILVVTGIVVGLSVILAIIGVSATGIPANV